MNLIAFVRLRSSRNYVSSSICTKKIGNVAALNEMLLNLKYHRPRYVPLDTKKVDEEHTLPRLGGGNG